MNVLEAMKKVKEGGIIKRKLDNGITEYKEFRDNGQIWTHFFLNENGKFHGECKWWWRDGTLGDHKIYEDGELIKR